MTGGGLVTRPALFLIIGLVFLSFFSRRCRWELCDRGKAIVTPCSAVPGRPGTSGRLNSRPAHFTLVKLQADCLNAGPGFGWLMPGFAMVNHP